MDASTNVNVSMERLVMPKQGAALAHRAGSVQLARLRWPTRTTSPAVETFRKTGNGGRNDENISYYSL